MKLTRAGMVYVAMTLLLGFAAVNTGNNLLYLLVSALLGFMAVSGWLGQQNLRHLEVKLNLPQEIFAGKETLAGIQLINTRRLLPAFLVRVRFGDDPPLFAQVHATKKEQRSLRLRWPKRGLHRVDTLWIESCFPINFFVRSLRIKIDQNLLVYPQPLAGLAPVSNGLSPQRQQLATSVRGDSGDLRSIHDYRGGEPLKSIHWKHSARHATFKVKQHEGLGAQPILIDLHELSGTIEEKLCRASGLVIDQLRRQRPVGLKLLDRTIPPQVGFGQRRRLLTELALYNDHS